MPGWSRRCAGPQISITPKAGIPEEPMDGCGKHSCHHTAFPPRQEGQERPGGRGHRPVYLSDQQSHCSSQETKQRQLLFLPCRGAVADLVTCSAGEISRLLIKLSAAAQSNYSESLGLCWGLGPSSGPGRAVPGWAHRPCPRRSPLARRAACSSPPPGIFSISVDFCSAKTFSGSKAVLRLWD